VLLAATALLAAVLLWRLDERGRKLAIAMLAIGLANYVVVMVRSGGGSLGAPYAVIMLAVNAALSFARLLLLAYLLQPRVKATFRQRSARTVKARAA
jgi:hypothetical protein